MLILHMRLTTARRRVLTDGISWDRNSRRGLQSKRWILMGKSTIIAWSWCNPWNAWWQMLLMLLLERLLSRLSRKNSLESPPRWGVSFPEILGPWRFSTKIVCRFSLRFMYVLCLMNIKMRLIPDLLMSLLTHHCSRIAFDMFKKSQIMLYVSSDRPFSLLVTTKRC
jgi:hypothetical protein